MQRFRDNTKILNSMKENKRINMSLLEVPNICLRIEGQQMSIIKHTYPQLTCLGFPNDDKDADGS